MIPISVFQLLNEIVEIQTHTLKPLPVKFETIYPKDYAQLEERYQVTSRRLLTSDVT